MSRYYTKKDLEGISIKAFAAYLNSVEGINYSDELVDDIDLDFVLDNADIFRQGICQLFAYALNQKYQYPVYIISSGKSLHIFCKSKDGKKYIDVRGVTDNFDTFISGTDLLYMPIDTSKLYSFEDGDFCGEYYDIGLEFAKAIIAADPTRYKA